MLTKSIKNIGNDRKICIFRVGYRGEAAHFLFITDKIL